MYSELRMPFVADLKPTFTFFSLLGSLTLLRTPQSRDILIFDLFCTGEHEKTLKYATAYFSKIAEIFSTYWMDAQTDKNAEFNTTKSLLIQDWVFRLGFHPYKYAMQYNATSVYYRQYKGQ